MDKCIDTRGLEYLANIFSQIAKEIGCETPSEAIALFRQMMVDMELKNPVAVNRKEELEVLSTSVNPVRLKNNPIRIEPAEAYYLYDVIIG